MAVLVIPGPPQPGDPTPPIAPAVDGVPDLTLPDRPRVTRGLRPGPLPRSRVWIGFDDEEGRCALL